MPSGYPNNNKYVLIYNNNVYHVKTLNEAGKICGKSKDCMNRILHNMNKYKKNTSKHLLDFKIYKI